MVLYIGHLKHYDSKTDTFALYCRQVYYSLAVDYPTVFVMIGPQLVPWTNLEKIELIVLSTRNRATLYCSSAACVKPEAHNI